MSRRRHELGILGTNDDELESVEDSVTGGNDEFPLERTDTSRTDEDTDEEPSSARGLIGQTKRSSLIGDKSGPRSKFSRNLTSSAGATGGGENDGGVTDDIDKDGREDWVPQSLIDDDERPNPIGAVAELCTELNKCGRFRYYAAHSMREAGKRKFNFCLGCCSCFLVVVIAAVCYTMIDKAPAIFLNEGEQAGGQVDLKMHPSESSNAPFLNYTQVNLNAQAHPSLLYNTPRIEWRSNVNIYGHECTETVRDRGLSFTDKAWRYGGDPSVDCAVGVSSAYRNGSDCLPSVCSGAFVLDNGWLNVIDSALEKRMGLGRHWPYEAIPEGHIMLDKALALRSNISEGQVVWMEVNMEDYEHPYFTTMVAKAAADRGLNASSVREALDFIRLYSTIVFPVTVWKVIDNDFGKFDEDQRGSLIIMEYAPLWNFLLGNVNPSVDTYAIAEHDSSGTVTVGELLRSQRLSDYSKAVYMNLPPPRTDAYLQTDYAVIQANVILFASRALYFVNFPDVDVELDVLSELYILRFFTLFLGLILSIILAILFILSTMLIYSLLTISIETRTFELGVHRMVGMQRFGIVEMLSAQALSYALPAWVLGLIVGRIAVEIVLQGIENSVGVPIHKELTSNSILAATCLGLVIPMIAAVVPIRHALDSNLFEALDTTHSKTQAVKVTLSRTEDGGMPAVLIALGIALTVFGFLIYYLMPLSLLSFNLALFFNIFFGILLAMLFGLVLLSLNLEHPMEKLVTGLTLWWEQRPVRTMVLKNLIAHRVRNRKTTIMYALAIGFTIFITVTFSMELQSAELRTLQRAGAKLRVRTSWWGGDTIKPDVVAKIHDVMEASPAVSEMAFITQDLAQARGVDGGYFITNLGHVAFAPMRIWGVSPNYFDVADSRFVKSTRSLDTRASISEQLYTVLGSQSMPLPASVTQTHAIDSLDFKGSFLCLPSLPLNDNPQNLTVDIRHLKPLSLHSKLPRFRVGQFETTREQDAIVSLPTYMRMLNKTMDLEDVPIVEIIFKFADTLTTENLNEFVDTLGAMDEGFAVSDFRDLEESLDKSRASMTVIFGTATYIAMGLCMFSLMASMYTNIFEQSKEIAILRAMGMTQGQITRIYIYESFVLVMSSSFLGVMIGCVIAWSMAMQRVLFTELPVAVEFPTTLLIMVIIGALISAVVASWAPARQLLQKQVAQVMRTVV